MPLTIGVPRESTPGETRVALTPDAAGRLAKKGADVIVEAGAGATAWYGDAEYAAAGARVGSRAEALGAAVVAC